MPASPSITQLYVFGDSLSDMGTVFRATGGIYPPSPNYFQGRYSNGRVWVEYLADRLQLSSHQVNNFAWGGATTGTIDGTTGSSSAIANLVPHLLTQVASFVQYQPKSDPASLYVIWAGANDYLQGIQNPTVPVNHIMQAIATLVKTGGKKFLIANLPDLGQLPATHTSLNAANLTALTQTHNQSLRRSLKQLSQQQPDLQIALLDANTLYQEAISQPATFGLKDVTNACLIGNRVCAKPDQFLFWDGIHPTTAAHRILGDTALTAIANADMLGSHALSLP